MDFGPSIPFPEAILAYIIIVWVFIWKAIALWRAANSHQRNWFIVILFIYNTFGLLEIIYLFRFAKKRMTFHEIKHWFTKTFSQKKNH